MSDRLKGKVAVITGGGSGIGRASAELFSREGAKIVVADIDSAGAEEATQAIQDAGGQAVCHPTDVTDPDAMDVLVDRSVAEFGRLDIMFNNAGGAIPESTHKMTTEKYREVVALNMDGVFYGTRAALRVMLPQKSGCILTTTSGAGLGAVKGLAAYGMAKAGIINLAQNVAKEYGPFGIRANVVSPGPIRSEGFMQFLNSVDGLQAKMEGGVPLQRLGQASEIAHAALFLASDEASYVSGVVIPVDGGISGVYATPTPDMDEP